MIRGEHRVGRFLKERGYRFLQIGSWWSVTQDNALADESYSFGLSEFSSVYLNKTIFPRLVQAALPRSRLASMMVAHGQCHRVPLQAQMVTDIARRPEVTFTFVHVLVPHPPFVFDAAGNCRMRDEVSKLTPRTLYVDQVAYANRLMTKVVTSLLASSRQKPVIILQADEGPFPDRYEKGDRSWLEARPDELDTKSGILNAYYFPDADYSELYPDVTPVNSFRLLFNKYFKAGYTILPDRIFSYGSSFYDFFEVTDKVRAPGNEAEGRAVGSDAVAGKI
jgi:hypothetical protein